MKSLRTHPLRPANPDHRSRLPMHAPKQAGHLPQRRLHRPGLLYLPQGAGPHPALIVIHEWWGLNDWIKQEAARYAAKGYVTLAVDLYRGKVATTPDLAHELSRGLPQDQGVRDLTSAFAYLRAART